MNWQIIFKETAKKDIKKLSPSIQKRIAAKIQFFISQPNPLTYATKMLDRDVGEYRWRIGNYRILFDVKAKTIIVLVIEHRREVYRK